ncbi:hypothetical protein HS1genome_1821 [Sulfodiicoccus acidiphilus]|uniref:Uncharacterized protein n=1 Tax=Sulfodiicoccus acidiphilus TaxID=1670455 RepID=A0A348B5I0_9CREN|nr:hypothetical protein [Sulfodiicoccus acidiphilus]BBD73432.1 hypothetical protein HS1genome_1821 [Sulfodiicoccus acidiphilus]GGT98579.1 hypothetical protein GCM10007116_14980 [Sulfodiicoccus acidiphilus]
MSKRVTIPAPSFLSHFYPDKRRVPLRDRSLLNSLREIVRPHYPNLDSFLDHVGKISNNEAKLALEAGADSVQFEAPDILRLDVHGQYNEGRGKVRESVSTNNEVLSKLPQDRLRMHSCWVNLLNSKFDTLGQSDHPLHEICQLQAGIIGLLELFESIRDFEELKFFKECEAPEER